MTCSVPRLASSFHLLRLCIGVLSALLCCQNRRLVIQSGWRGVVQQIRPVLKDLLLHTTPYVGWDWLPAYRRSTFASFLPVSFISLRPLPQTRPLSQFLSELSELHTYFPSLSNCFSFSYLQMHCQILLLSSIRGWKYKCISSPLYLLPVQSIISFIFRQSKDIRVKLLSLQPFLAPQLCTISSHFCLSDCTACLAYSWVDGQFKRQKIHVHLVWIQTF